MVKEGYKETLIGVLPEEWDIEKIGDVINVVSGYGFKSSEFVENGINVVKIGSMQNGSVIVDDKSDFLPEKYYKEYEKYQLKDGDVLIALSGATTGKIAVFDSKIGKALLNQRVGKFDAKSNKLRKKFMRYFVDSHSFYRYVLSRMGRSAQGNLSPTKLKKTHIPLPPLPEQKKIASILSSVDESIEKTDEVIEETKELKKGLMQKLLTKGIGHSEFKDSQFGEIPKSWEINVMSYAAKINPRYKIPEKNKYLFLEMDSVSEHSPEVDGYEKRKKSRCTNVKFKKGDVLFARITPSTENGKTALIENLEEEVAFGSTELIVLSPKKDLIISDYIYYLLKWSKVRNLAISMMEGSTGRQRVPREVFDGAIKIPLPSIEEQKKITSILSSVDSKIQKEEEYKAKLERLKKGLMQKLLTGEIRVNTEMEV